jgi:tagatose-6-phosphate ketose/aldose isomerase
MSSVDKETKASASLTELQARPLAKQRELGYADTLREILQQPATWRDTASMLKGATALQVIARALNPMPGQVVLTGSGSSMYIGECLAPSLQLGLEVPVQAIAAGNLLTHWRSMLPPQPGLLISLARSGDSPESTGVVSRLLAEAPAWRHLVMTCNARGKLATHYADDPRVTVLVLDEATNDRSLVMTSSFTNLLLAGTGLAQGRRGDATPDAIDRAATVVQRIFERQADALVALAGREFSTAVYLGSGGALGAAHECALKMLEMTGGQVLTAAETFLGLRHGPMSSVHPSTLVFGLLSPDPAVRAYEVDLLRELSRKQLGMAKLLVGEGIPADLIGPDDVAIELDGLDTQVHEETPTLLAGIAVGQLLAFFRCLSQGGRPDAPSQGVLTRVVEDFAIHGD